MPSFNELFDQWADFYDETVYGSDNEYIEVFANYDEILTTICREVGGERGKKVLEIGTGTGNLTKVLHNQGFNVIGVEPSKEMRKQTRAKVPNIEVVDGHFLWLPMTTQVDAIVTSYALHHLNYQEKAQAVAYLDEFLRPKGNFIIADTMFESELYKHELFKYVEAQGSFKLLKDLNMEYYEYLEDVCQLFGDRNYKVERRKMNKYVWLVIATKL